MLSKYKKIPIPAKASIWFVLCSIFQKGISFLTVPIFTRVMTTKQYGVYNTYLSWYQILLIFTSLNLYYGVFNNAMIKYEKQRDRYISSMQGIVTVLTLVFFVIYLMFRSAFNNLFNLETPLVLLLFIELLITPALQFWTVHNRFKYKYKKIVWVTVVKTLLNPILGIIFVVNSDNKDIARIVSIVLVEFIICGVIAIYQFYKGRCFFDKEFWKYAILFNLPLVPHYLSGLILSQGDRVIISKLLGESAVAFYSVAYNIGVMLNIIVVSINSSLTPWIYQKIKLNKAQDIKNVINATLVLMFVLIFIVIILAPEALDILAPKEYKEAVYVIPPIASSTFFFFMYIVFANIEFYYEKRKFVSIGSIVAAIINIILNIIFIPIFGYYAAGYTTLLCYIIFSFINFKFSLIIIDDKMKGVNVFDKKIIYSISFVLLIMTIILNFVYKSTILRYGLVLIVGVLVIIYRKVLLSYLKELKNK